MDRCTGCVSSLVSDLGSRAPFLGKHPTTPQPQLSSAVSQPEDVKCPFSPEILSQFVITNFLSHKAAVTPSTRRVQGPEAAEAQCVPVTPILPWGPRSSGGGRYAPFTPQGNSFCSLLLKMWPNRQKDMKSINCASCVVSPRGLCGVEGSHGPAEAGGTAGSSRAQSLDASNSGPGMSVPFPPGSGSFPRSLGIGL